MPRFMIDRTVQAPPGYAERGCLLVSYRLPLVDHCFVLCHEASIVRPDPTRNELLQFFIAEASRLAEQSVGDSEAFMLIHSGRAVRKRANWHLHVFVVQHRWQKAWVYTVLAMKNIGLCCLQGLTRLLPRGAIRFLSSRSSATNGTGVDGLRRAEMADPMTSHQSRSEWN